MSDTSTPPVEPKAPVAAGPDDGPKWTTANPTRLVEILRRLVGFPVMLAKHRDLVTSSVRRELAARFQGTLLGFLWPLVHPLFIFAVYYFIFTKLLSFKMPDLDESQESAMGVYMFIGVVVWAAFGESLVRGCNIIVENGNLIKKLAFPTETLPLNVVLVNVVTMLFGIVMFLVATFTTPVWPAPGVLLLWIPVLLFLQVLFTYGLVLLLSSMQVFLRDTAQVISIFVTVWMFLTPLFWVPEAIPQIASYYPYIEANPMNHIVHAWREVLMGVEPVLQSVQEFTNNNAIHFENLAITQQMAELTAAGAPAADIAALEATKWPLLEMKPNMLNSIRIFSYWAFGSFLIGFIFFGFAQRRFADEV